MGTSKCNCIWTESQHDSIPCNHAGYSQQRGRCGSALQKGHLFPGCYLPLLKKGRAASQRSSKQAAKLWALKQV